MSIHHALDCCCTESTSICCYDQAITAIRDMEYTLGLIVGYIGMYQSVLSQNEYPAKLRNGCTGHDIKLSCDRSETIYIIGAYYMRGARGDSCSWERGDCQREVTSNYYRTIRGSCDGQNSCSFLAESADLSCSMRKYVAVEYRCTQSADIFPPATMNMISRCIGETFDVSLCFGETHIDISAAYYMDIGGLTTNCNRRNTEKDCRTSVELSYLDTIKSSCSGQQSCGDLRARAAGFTACNPERTGGSQLHWNTNTEYVAIVYTCVPTVHTLPTPSTTTTRTTLPTTSTLTPVTTVRSVSTHDMTKLRTESNEYSTEAATSQASTSDLRDGMQPRNENTLQSGDDNITPNDAARVQDVDINQGLVIGITVVSILFLGAIVALTAFIVKWKKAESALPRENPYTVDEDGYTELNNRPRFPQAVAMENDGSGPVYNEVTISGREPEYVNTNQRSINEDQH